MKTKISRILGASLALLIVFSMAFALVPTKAEAAPCAWTPETIPSAAGLVLSPLSDISGLAVGPDGTTIWAIDREVAPPGRVLVSTNGGRTFTDVTANIAGLAAPNQVTHVAVAPDNPSVVIVSDNLAAGDRVWLTTNGGISWANLGAPVVAATATVTDIAVSPAIAGSILGRYYFATVADDASGTTTLGTVRVIGTPAAGAAWGTVAPALAVTFHDYMAIEVTPGFLGDQSICVVGTDNVGTVDYQIINTNTPAVTVTVTFVPRANLTYDYRFPIVADNSTVCADVALPNDFDATSFAGQRAYVGIGMSVAATTDDVYRIDGPAFRRLNAVTTLAINTVSFSGVINGGILFEGEYAAANVRFSPDPTTGAPSWNNSAKSPTGPAAAAQTIVRVSPNFPANSNVFAGTTGAESAVSLSYNGGVSFNQISLIDTNIHILNDVMPTPDGKTVYLATSCNVSAGSGFESLWKSSVPSNVFTWDRIRLSIVAGVPANWTDASIIRLNPDWATAPRLYWCQIGGAATNIQTSPDGGDTYNNRVTTAAILDVAVEDGSILYYANANFVYKSANSAYTWGPPVDGQAGAARTLAMAPSYPYKPVAGNLLVGGTGAVGSSTNGGTSFARLADGLAGTALLQVLADQNYGTSGAPGYNTIYAGDTTGGTNNTYRFVLGTSPAWDNILTGAAFAVGGLGMENGAFYSLVPGAGAYRTLVPFAAPGTIPWDTCGVGPGIPAALAAPSALRVAGGTLYAIDTTQAVITGRLVSYADLLQTAKAAIAAPAGGATLPVDPVNGRALPVTLNWSPMGFGTGLVNTYNVFIYEKAAGFAGSAPNAVALIPPAITAPTVRIVNPGTAAGTDIAYLFIAGREYGIQIQATAEVSGDNITSSFCDPVFFAIAAGLPQVEMTPPLVVPPITVPPITIPPVTIPPAQVVSPAWIWAVVIIGAILVIMVLILIWKTRAAH